MQQHQLSSQQHASTAAGSTQPSKQQQSSQQQHQQPQQQGHHPPATAAPAGGGEGGSWGLEQHYDLLGKIGEGTYGVVYLATAKQDKKQLFAIKKFKTGRVSMPAL
jgi:serine/threonine protein kinase